LTIGDGEIRAGDVRVGKVPVAEMFPVAVAVALPSGPGKMPILAELPDGKMLVFPVPVGPGTPVKSVAFGGTRVPFEMEAVAVGLESVPLPRGPVAFGPVVLKADVGPVAFGLVVLKADAVMVGSMADAVPFPTVALSPTAEVVAVGEVVPVWVPFVNAGSPCEGDTG
jgi:hypothetical protein